MQEQFKLLQTRQWNKKENELFYRLIFICTYNGPFVTRGWSMEVKSRKLGNEGGVPRTKGPLAGP